MSAIGYVRVSTAEQAATGYGLDIQRDAIADYCERNGLALDAIEADEGQSGSNGIDTRQGLARLLGRAEAGDVSQVIVYRLDRLARDLLLQETLIGRLRLAGVEVVSVSEPDVGSEEPTRVLVRQVLGAIAEYERAVIRGRMMAGRAAKVAAGGWGGGGQRYGLRAQGGSLQPDEGEQGVMRLVWSMAADGCSHRAIADRLNARGLKTRRGAAWTKTQVSRILSQRSF